MSEEIKKISELEQQLADARTELENLKTGEKEKQIASLGSEVDSLKAEIVAKETEVAGLAKKLEETQATLNDTKTKFDEVAKELTDIRLDQIVSARKIALAKFEIAENDLSEIIDEVKSMSDEAFAKYLSRAERLFKVKAPVQAVEAPKTEAKEVVAEAALETAMANKEDVLFNNAGDENNLAEQAKAAIAEVFGLKDKKETK